jgi:S1-C subfamily serine protease
MNNSESRLFFFLVCNSLLLITILTVLSPATVNGSEISVISGEGNQKNYSLTELYKIIEKSVVQIDVYDSRLGALGLGSGFIYDNQGHVVTNHHVADQARVSALSYDVIFSDGHVYSAKLIGTDPFSDLAVIRIENASDLNITSLKMGNSSMVKPGEQIAILGSAKGLIGTFTTGIVSAVGRSGFTGMSSTGEDILAGMSSLGVSFDQPNLFKLMPLLIMEIQVDLR